MRQIQLALVLLVLVFSTVNCQKKSTADASGMGSSDTLSSAGLRSVYYDYDNGFIRNDQVGSLQGNASFVKSSNAMVTVEGHCDERGTNEYNLALGQRRADASRDYLVNLGVNPGLVRTASFGEEKPVCYESDESCWWKNRRADFRR